jgi:hypothetical protein
MSNFKMKHQGVPALMKTLTAGQQGMIKSMKESGKTAQAESIKKGIEDAPVRKEGETLSPEERRRISDYRQGKGRVKVTTSRNSRGAGKLAGGTGETDRKITGYGEINTKVAGSRGSRMASDSRGNKTRVVREGSASRIKSVGIQSPKVKKTDISKDLKERAPRKKVKKVNEITKTAAVKKKGVKGLKKAALKKYGKKK